MSHILLAYPYCHALLTHKNGSKWPGRTSAAHPGRPAEACTFLCVAERPGTTYEDPQGSGDFVSIECKFAAGLPAGIITDLRYRTTNLKAQKHKAGRMLKGR
eukprot:3837672-Pyramimonas_sp.AAC.1